MWPARCCSPRGVIHSAFHTSFPYSHFNKDQDVCVWLVQPGLFVVNQRTKNAGYIVHIIVFPGFFLLVNHVLIVEVRFAPGPWAIKQRYSLTACPLDSCSVSSLSSVLHCPLFSQAVFQDSDLISVACWCYQVMPLYCLFISSGAFMHVSACNLFISTLMFLLRICIAEVH